MGKFDFLKSVGATEEAVAVLNDQPNLFTNLILVLIGLSLQAGLLWYIHYATLKPSQKKKPDTKSSSRAGGMLGGLGGLGRGRAKDNARRGPGK